MILPILQANALMTAWESFVTPRELSYILGNPPFVGKKHRTKKQQEDMANVFGDAEGIGVLDYVTAWYVKAARYIRGTEIRCAFVSTNSISQGEQAGVLWGLLRGLGIKIHFAHRTFRWNNEARGMAHVHVVIIGFGDRDIKEKVIFEYDDIRGDPVEVKARDINGYLKDAGSVLIENRAKPLCEVPKIVFGNSPIEGGFLLFSDEEKKEFLRKQPEAKPFMRRFIGAREFIRNIPRWCLWLENAPPVIINKMPEVLKRLNAVRRWRLASKRETTRRLADVVR